MTNRIDHWNNIYNTKELNQVSWYQPNPEISLKLIKDSQLPKDAAIIDVGGGDSFLTDRLIDLGYSNITVLDISEKALQRAQQRLGQKAHIVQWIVSDITLFSPQIKYDLWHDRAAFHFLTTQEEIEKYKKALYSGIKKDSHFIVGTFSEIGPDRCSGINIRKYTKEGLAKEFKPDLETLQLYSEKHQTPFNTIQHFSFAHLKKY